MTGQHTGHCWIRGNSPGDDLALRAEDVTVGEVKAAEYSTGIIGKWGMGEAGSTGAPNRKGFDYFYGYLNHNHAHNHYPEYLWKNDEKVSLPNVVEKKVVKKAVKYSHDLFTEEALEFINKQKEKPFFLYLAYTIPHGKWEVPSDAPYTDISWEQPTKNYAAMITRMDTDVGKIMKLLKDLKLDEQTIVFFSSDNGPQPGAYKLDFFQSGGQLRGVKRDLYEGGIRVPVIARWPGKFKAGAVSEQVWAFWDFLPTVAELTGAKAPEKLNGISMVPTLLGEKAAGRAQNNHDFLYWEFHEGGSKQAVRMGDWKLVRWPATKDNKPELFDLKSDPGEKNDVAAKNPDVVSKIEAYLKDARTESKQWPLEPRKEKTKK